MLLTYRAKRSKATAELLLFLVVIFTGIPELILFIAAVGSTLGGWLTAGAVSTNAKTLELKPILFVGLRIWLPILK